MFYVQPTSTVISGRWSNRNRQMRSQLSKEKPSQINMYKYYWTYWFILHWWYARMSQHISFQNLVPKWVSQTRPKQQTCPSKDCPIILGLSWVSKWVSQTRPKQQTCPSKDCPIILGLSWVSRHWTPTYGFQGRWEGRRQLKGCVKVAVAVLDCSGWLLH